MGQECSHIAAEPIFPEEEMSFHDLNAYVPVLGTVSLIFVVVPYYIS